LLGVLGLVFIVHDTTRVVAHASFPLLFACFLTSAPRLAAVAQVGGRDLAVVALILPVVWVIGGDAEASTLGYGWQFLSHHWFGFPDIPDRWWDWPFRWGWPRG
jgi:hypothetical protein